MHRQGDDADSANAKLYLQQVWQTGRVFSGRTPRPRWACIIAPRMMSRPLVQSARMCVSIVPCHARLRHRLWLSAPDAVSSLSAPPNTLPGSPSDSEARGGTAAAPAAASLRRGNRPLLPAAAVRRLMWRRLARCCCCCWRRLRLLRRCTALLAPSGWPVPAELPVPRLEVKHPRSDVHTQLRRGGGHSSVEVVSSLLRRLRPGGRLPRLVVPALVLRAAHNTRLSPVVGTLFRCSRAKGEGA